MAIEETKKAVTTKQTAMDTVGRELSAAEAFINRARKEFKLKILNRQIFGMLLENAKKSLGTIEEELKKF